MVRFVIAETRDLRVAKRILATGGELPKGEEGAAAAGKNNTGTQENHLKLQ